MIAPSHIRDKKRTKSQKMRKKFGPFLDLCVSSLRRGHANLLCIVPILSDVPEGTIIIAYLRYINVLGFDNFLDVGLPQMPYLVTSKTTKRKIPQFASGSFHRPFQSFTICREEEDKGRGQVSELGPLEWFLSGYVEYKCWKQNSLQYYICCKAFRIMFFNIKKKKKGLWVMSFNIYQRNAWDPQFYIFYVQIC